MYSQMSSPGTLVGIGLYSPRMPEGASGFMSNMSRCGGPPARNTMMTALCDRETPAWASACNNWGSESPPSAKPPILRKSRRLTPSQNSDRLRPAIVSIKLVLSCKRRDSGRRRQKPPLNIYLTPPAQAGKQATKSKIEDLENRFTVSVLFLHRHDTIGRL